MNKEINILNTIELIHQINDLYHIPVCEYPFMIRLGAMAEEISKYHYEILFEAVGRIFTAREGCEFFHRLSVLDNSYKEFLRNQSNLAISQQLHSFDKYQVIIKSIIYLGHLSIKYPFVRDLVNTLSRLSKEELSVLLARIHELPINDRNKAIHNYHHFLSVYLD